MLARSPLQPRRTWCPALPRLTLSRALPSLSRARLTVNRGQLTVGRTQLTVNRVRLTLNRARLVVTPSLAWASRAAGSARLRQT